MSDDEQPLSRTEAAAWCKMHVRTFDKKIRPYLKERRFGVRRNIFFQRGDLRRLYAEIFKSAPPGPPD